MVSGHHTVHTRGSRVGAQGAFYFPNAAGDSEEDEVEGVYVYPDWSSCVSGTWRHYTLVQGRYCRVTGAEEAGAGLVLHTAPLEHSPALTYSPPSYTSFGLPPTQRDPFENSTVAVRESVIGRASNEGSRRFHNHGDGPYSLLLLILLSDSHLRHY